MNRRARAAATIEKLLRAGALATALALDPFRAEAMLRTIVVAAQAPIGAEPELALDVPEAFVFTGAESCDEAVPAVDALEGAVVEVKARYWAYLMRQPDFFLGSPARHPGSEIGNPAVRAYFESRLLFWYRQKDVRAPSLATIAKINDVSQKISAMTAACAKTKS